MTDTLSHLVHTVRPKTGPRIILPLGIALSAALAPGQDLPKPSIIPNLPGALYTAADPMAFTVKLSAALTDHGATSTVTVVIANIAGKTMETVAALELSPNNNYTATVQPSTLGLGYYSFTASLPAKPGSNSKQSSLSFGIIPDVGLKGPQPACTWRIRN
jgi:hypothetical protein